jgi:phosphate transport system protein
MPYKKFHNELKEQKEEILKMGKLVRGMLHDSVLAMKTRDLKLAEEVISKQDELSNYDENIEENLLKLIALYQPVAKDMRLIACGLKMITYIARVGRYGRDIAKVTHELKGEPLVAKLVHIPHMEKHACDMVHDALKAFEAGDIQLLKDFRQRDDHLDDMRYSIFRECLTYMMEDQKNITPCAHYVMVARYIERCGDHACKMGEKIHYMVTGERIEIK